MRKWSTMRQLTAMLCLAVLGAPVALAGKTPEVGEVFPNFKAKDMFTGKEIELKDFRGKVVLIDFWATWCGPCRAELPHVKKVYKKYHDKGFEIISISLDESIDTCKKYAKENDLKWHHIADGKGWNAELGRKYGIRAIPAAFVLDREGKVITGKARGARLDRAIEKGLAKGGDSLAADDDLDEEADLQEAEDLARNGKNEDALAIYERLANGASDDDIKKEAARRVKTLKDKMAAAESDSGADRDQLARDAADRGEKWLRVARQMAEAKSYDLARRYYQRVIENFPGTDQALKAQKELKALPG